MERTLTNQNPGQILQHETFNSDGFTDHNSLAKMRMSNPDKLTPAITHLMGREDAKFPLTFLTEGQSKGVRTEEIQNVEYTWDVMGRMKISDTLMSTEYASDAEVGKGGVIFYATFKTNWLKQQHIIIAPDGTKCHIKGKPVPVGGKQYKYALQLIYSDPNAYVPSQMLQAGVRWSMTGGAPVAESYSSGNESNKQAPGRMKNQISFLRKSYEIGGNVGNKTTEFQFRTAKGVTNAWMPFEEYQHELEFKAACEEHLWWSTYNRDLQGNITTTDLETGFPIPMGAGLSDQIPHKDTYGELTVKKLSKTVGDVMYGRTDTGKMEVVLFTGYDGSEFFDAAIKREANGAGGWTLLQGNAADKFVQGTAGSHSLSFGAYFNKYVHVDGHVITVKLLALLDQGGRADNAERHPVTGRPLTSSEMYFVDMSTYDGERNVKMVSQKGRSLIRGIHQGMSLVKGTSYGDYTGNSMNINLATDQDKTSIHFMKSLGVNLSRNTHCFKLSCSLS